MKRFKLIAGIALCILVMAGLAWASEGGEAAHGEAAVEHGLNWMDFLYRCINFALVAGVLAFLAGKKAKDGLKGRSVQIENQLSDLETRKADAENRLKSIASSISNLEAEKAEIMEEYRKQGETLKASIVAAAEEKAVAIKAQAKMTAEQESKAAVEKLRAEMADMVVEAAEKMLASKLTEKDQDKLVDEYLTKVVLN